MHGVTSPPMQSQRSPLSPTTENALANRLLWLPKLAVVLLVTAVLALLWVLHHQEQDEQRNTLISDVLWLEQNLQFQLSGSAEHLSQLAADLAASKASDRSNLFALRAEHLVRNTDGLEYLVRLTPDGQPTTALPHPLTLPQHDDLQRAFNAARKLQRPFYLEPVRNSGGRAWLVTIVATQDSEQFLYLAAFTDLQVLLESNVPWWFAQKYQVRLVNDAGTELGRKNLAEPGHELSAQMRYDLSLDPPGYGTKLSVSAQRSESGTEQRLLAIAIVLLATSVFISLWIIRSQMQRRQHTEEALKAEYAFRESMENSLTVGMRARDLTGRIIYVNAAFSRMTGFSQEELIGLAPPMPYWLPDELEETYSLHHAVMSGNAPPDGFEVNLRRKTGEPFRALIYEAPLIDGKGQHIGWMGSVLDVTERHKAEELARQQAEKLQSTARLVTMGEMASTLAHELNQPLAAITSYNSGCLNLLPSLLTHPEHIKDFEQALQKLGAQAQRAGRIIHRVHEFVKKREPKRAPCNLRDIIEDSLGFSEAEVKKYQAILESHIPEALPLVDADRLMIEQVLLNLIRNGLEAMRNTPSIARRLVISVTTQRDAVTIRVRDCGCGVPEDIKDKLFTAFFTTKAEGLGIGLSICRSIVEFHQGRLWLETPAHGGGSIFAFSLRWAAQEKLS